MSYGSWWPGHWAYAGGIPAARIILAIECVAEVKRVVGIVNIVVTIEASFIVTRNEPSWGELHCCVELVRDFKI